MPPGFPHSALINNHLILLSLSFGNFSARDKRKMSDQFNGEVTPKISRRLRETTAPTLLTYRERDTDEVRLTGV